MALGLVVAGIGLGLFSALLTLLAGGGWLWAGVVYALSGCFGLLAAAGLMLWRTPDTAPRARKPAPAAPAQPET